MKRLWKYLRGRARLRDALDWHRVYLAGLDSTYPRALWPPDGWLRTQRQLHLRAMRRLERLR